MIYTFADVSVDTDTQELRRGGEPIHVEPQVLAVLEYLVAHRDRVVTKIELLDEVWGDRFVSESALTSRIKSARRACGDSGREQRVIRTVHGRGYRFVADVQETAPEPSATSGLLTAPPGAEPGGLVGREVEMTRVESAMTAVANGQRQALFLTGDAGIGKSAVLAEFLERIDDPSAWYVLRGRCLQQRGGAEPYFCLFDAFGNLARAEGEEVIDVIERVAPSWLAQLPSLLDAERSSRIEHRALGTTSARMLREGSDIVEELSRSRPVMLALEDLHWADGCALDVLELLIQRSDRAPVLVIGTARAGAGAAESLIASMTATGRAVEVRLGGLDPAGMDALVRDWFDGASVPDDLVSLTSRRSAGVPLFAQGMLATWVNQGQLLTEGGAVGLVGSVDELETVPDSIRPLIERELNELDSDEVGLLEAAAVVGAEFEGSTVAAAVAQPLDEVESRLSSVARRFHYVDAVGGSSWPDGTVSTRYSFNHDLYREALYERTPAARRATLHSAVGVAIERGHMDNPAELVVVLARHFAAAGDAARTVEYLRMSGEQAAARSAHSHAVGFLTDALERLNRLPASDQRDQAEVRIRLSLGPSLVAIRGWLGESVMENYERAMELAGEREDFAEVALARYGMATVTELRGQYGRTEELLTPMVGADDDELQLEVRELFACSTFHQGAFEHSLQRALSVLDSWQEGDHSAAMARYAEHPAVAANSWASWASWYLGHSDESLVLADRAIALGEQNLYALSTARAQRSFLHQFRNEPEQCAEWAEATASLAKDQGFPTRIVQARIMLGWVEAVTGSPDDGIAKLIDGLNRYISDGARLTVPYFIGLHGDALLAAGQPEESREVLEKALANMAETTRTFFYEPELHRLTARAVYAATEDVDAARLSLDLSLERSGATDNSPPLALRASCDRLRLERRHGDPTPWVDRVVSILAGFDSQADTPDSVAAREALAG